MVPEGVKPIGNMIIFKVKIMCRTGRLTPSKLDWKEKVIIINSYLSYDKTLSSVATLESIRILLALFTSYDLQKSGSWIKG